MTDFQNFLSNSLLFTEGLAAAVSVLYFRNVKGHYWKYFTFYLIIIFFCEGLAKWWEDWSRYSKIDFFNYFVIPLQFIFLYWLYAVKSLVRKNLFWLLSGLYILSFIPSELFFAKSQVIFSFNYTFGCLLLMILIILEYYKQINSGDIINFHKNKMFYINLGVTLFYIGTLPFWTFYSLLFYEHKDIWELYFSYHQVSDIVMYLLFSVSFVWAKQNSS